MPRLLPCLLLLLAVGCGSAPEPPAEPAVDLGAERASLMEADRAWFESHEDLARFLTFLDGDAVFMPAGAPASRGEAIGEAWGQLLSAPGFHLEWQADSAHVAEAGDLGYTLGSYELTVEQEGSPVTTVGKYVTVWKKQADGSWKVAVDCFNADGPPSGA